MTVRVPNKILNIDVMLLLTMIATSDSFPSRQRARPTSAKPQLSHNNNELDTTTDRRS
jgi:hypothetical protein